MAHSKVEISIATFLEEDVLSSGILCSMLTTIFFVDSTFIETDKNPYKKFSVVHKRHLKIIHKDYSQNLLEEVCNNYYSFENILFTYFVIAFS